MTSVELRTRVFHGYAVAVLRGELDTTGAGAAAGAVAALAAAGRQLIIDLETLDFTDCHAAGALLGAREAARRKGGDVLLAPRGLVLRLLAVLGVAGVYASVAAAADGGGGRPARRRIARFRAASAGAWYRWALRSGPVPGARAGGLSWSPRRLRARSGPRG
jgi:anti-anti-sigma factor